MAAENATASQPKVTTHEKVLNDDGYLNSNAISFYQLTGSAAEAFKECSQHIDQTLGASAFLLQAWLELQTSKVLSRLTADERCLLMIEAGIALLATTELTSAWQRKIHQRLHLELAKPALSSDVKVYGGCLVDLMEAVIGMHVHPLEKKVVHAMLKQVIVKASKVVDPSYNAICLKAKAYQELSILFFTTSGPSENFIRLCKKAWMLMLKSLAHTGMLSAASPIYVAVPSLPDHVERHAFVATFCRKALMLMTPDTVVNTLTLLKPFLQAAYIECKRCFAYFQANEVFDEEHEHTLSNLITPLPFDLEYELAMTFPDWVHYCIRAQWVHLCQERVSYVRFNPLAVDTDTLLQVVKARQLARKLHAMSLSHIMRGCLDRYYKRQEADLLPLEPGLPSRDQEFQSAFLDMIDLSRAVDGDLIGNFPDQLQQQLGPFFASHGVDVTVEQLLDKYKAMDKNVVREMRDFELLPLLGLKR
eukprot:m.252051 g.252051  ORF g.252051 m.252051 type:complete len:476 (+) comp17525_c0_seq6:294-1721(+)